LRVQPSTNAASSISRGTFSKKPINSRVENGIEIDQAPGLTSTPSAKEKPAEPNGSTGLAVTRPDAPTDRATRVGLPGVRLGGRPRRLSRAQSTPVPRACQIRKHPNAS
jgi:hypothetical protein